MAAQPKILKPGEFLFRDGDASNSMFLVQKGTISIRKGNDLDYVEISKIYANEVIGDLSFFDRRPRSAAAVALTDAEVVEIEFAALEKIYASVPSYLKTIMAALAERLRRSNDVIKRLEKRIAKLEGTSNSASLIDEDSSGGSTEI